MKGLPVLVLVAALAWPAAADAASRLRDFDSCAEVRAYAERHQRRAAPPMLGVLDVPAPVTRPAPAGMEGVASAAPGAADTSFSRTNVQEEGIDEPDVLKTDGRRAFAVVDGTLHVLDLKAGAPRLVSSRPLTGFAHQLLLHGDTLLVLAESGAGALLSELAVADGAPVTLRRTLQLPGRLVGARQRGGSVRVVSSAPATPDVAVPRSTLRSRVSGRTFRRHVVGCDDIAHPLRFGGLELLSVLTIDLDRGLYSVERDGVLANAQAVYASATALYVASTTVLGAVTQIHRYDTSDPGATVYRSTGEVPGTILNQFSLSEHAGHLRVASTTDEGDGTESRVTVLREQDRALVAVGRVTGLGRGERIYAVRFLGDVGYVVTFRQVDPLYTLDLSAPSSPKVLGELKILGYSAYLHPVGDDLLLGVGVDATEEGRRIGAQVSLFDVSDLRAPRRIAAKPLGAGTEVEFDHHAFLFWPAASLAVVPSDEAAIGLRVSRTGLTDAGRVTHPENAPVRRSFVAGDRLYTLSHAGLAGHALDGFAAAGFAAFPQPPRPPMPGHPQPEPAPADR